MVVEVIRYQLDEGRENDFKEAYGKAQQYLADSPHCLGYELVRCLKDRSRYVLLIRWDSAEGHLQGYRNSPDFKSFIALVAPFLKETEEMEHYEKIGIEWIKPS